MLKGNKCNNCRGLKIGTMFSHEMNANMCYMCLLSCYLDRHVLVISGKFGTKNKPITIGNYYAPIEESKYEAKNYSVMIDNGPANYCIISNTDKEN